MTIFSKGLDLQHATPLQKAIYDKDINRVKEIIPQLDAKQLKWELIHSKLDMLSSTSLVIVLPLTNIYGKTNLILFLRLSSLIVRAKLLRTFFALLLIPRRSRNKAY